MGRGTGLRVLAVAIFFACTAGAIAACGESERAAVTVTVTTDDGQRVVTVVEPADDGDDDGEEDGDVEPGCFGAGSGPQETCRRAPETEDDCITVRDEADAEIATITDQGELAAARLARGVALLCLNQRLDEAREDIAFARTQGDQLNDFSRETLEQIDLADPPTGPGEVQDVLQDADPGASSG